ncbi:MAG: XTP/dITP diphosphatase [Thermodesulfobacteriota bacterium]|jgi:XTP/dITP diphosphohydrolase
MIEEVVLATGNKGKIREFAGLLEGVFGKIISLNELDSPPEIIEDGKTFEENAIKKARLIAAYSGKPVLTDDSGLEVDALGGRPGVYSARYAGASATDRDNIDKLLIELHGIEQRKARFVCVLALVTHDGEEVVARGECDGVILNEPRGERGFGYDPIFFVPEFGKTMAEIDPGLKNKISHRARAAESLIRRLRGGPD